MADKQDKKVEKEKGMDIGRLLGVIAREDPELYGALKEYAEREGVKITEATINIIKKYFLYQKIEASNLSMEQVMTAWELFREMARDVIQMYTSMGAMFFSEMTEAWSKLIQEQVEKRLEMLKSEADPSYEIRKKMLDAFLNIVEPLMKSFMASALRAAGVQVPDELKLKVPVTIEKVQKQVDVKVE